MPLLKMTILAFKSFDNPLDLTNPSLFMAMFNPASYKVEYAFPKDETTTSGTTNESVPTTAISPQKMSFDFLIDGTGASGEDRIVLLEVRKFEKLVKFKEPVPALKKDGHLSLNKLLLLWGTYMFACEIESYSVNYTLFNQLGIPLRATISANFIESSAGSKLKLFDQVLDNDPVLDSASNLAGFLSNSFSVTQNAAKSAQMAREENLSSLRGKVNL